MLKIIYYSFVLIIINLITSSASASLPAVVTAFSTKTSKTSYLSSISLNSTDTSGNFFNHSISDRLFTRLLLQSKKRNPRQTNDTSISVFNPNSSIINPTTRYRSNFNVYTLKSNFKSLKSPTSTQATLNQLQDCKVTDDLKQNSLQSSIVLKGIAVEKFKYYSNSNKLKSYSILFEVERVYKLDEKLIYDYTNRSVFFSKPLTKHNFNLNNTNSFILIENFKYSDDTSSRSSNNKSCYSIDIKLNRSYYLYLNNSTQAYFNHPVRFKQENNKIKSTILMLRIPIFNLTGKPIETNRFNETYFRSSLCTNCSLVKVKFDRKIKSAHLKQNVKLICHLEGDQIGNLNVLWKKNRNSNLFIKNNSKFTIETNQKYSILNIKSVNYTDQGYYYCVVRDHSSLETNRFITDKIKLIILETNNTSTIGTTLAYTRITTFFDLFMPNKTNTNKLITLSTSKLNSLWSNRTQPKTTSFLASTTTRFESLLFSQKQTTKYNELYVECDQDENICWNGGTCYKTNPLLAFQQPDIIHKKFCICKKFYEPPYCEIESHPIEFDQNEYANEIPDDLKDLWNSLSFSRSVNLTNYRFEMKQQQTRPSSSAISTKLNNSKRINDYLFKKKKLFYRNNHI